MNYDVVTAVLVLLAVAAPLSLLTFHSLETGADLVSVTLARTVLVAAAAVQVVVTVPLLSDNVPEGGSGAPMSAFLGGMVVLAIGFACERYVVTGGIATKETD